jgi:hypothetical protein
MITSSGLVSATSAVTIRLPTGLHGPKVERTGSDDRSPGLRPPPLDRPDPPLFAQFIVVLDASIVNVALPSIGEALDFSQANLPWVVNAYILTFGGSCCSAGGLPTSSGAGESSSRACSWLLHPRSRQASPATRAS